jgi:ATP adenylyltransferase
MKKIYAPWRAGYLRRESHHSNDKPAHNDCVFCKHFSEDKDDAAYILKRFKTVVVMLNLYPYNAGHVLILPLSHTRELYELEPHVQHELVEVLALTLKTLQTTLEPMGFNMGANLGKAAGAGIPAHLHLHIVPRWNGDTNFLPVIGDTKAVSVDLNEIFKQLKKAFDALS